MHIYKFSFHLFPPWNSDEWRASHPPGNNLSYLSSSGRWRNSVKINNLDEVAKRHRYYTGDRTGPDLTGRHKHRDDIKLIWWPVSPSGRRCPWPCCQHPHRDDSCTRVDNICITTILVVLMRLLLLNPTNSELIRLSSMRRCYGEDVIFLSFPVTAVVVVSTGVSR